MPLPLLCLALAASVQAADLHVEITAPGGEPVAIEFPDVRFGTLPGFMVLGPNGVEEIVHITLSLLREPPAGEQPQILFDVVLQELSADKRGRAHLKVVSSPRIVTQPNMAAMVSQGFSIPVPGSDPAEATALTIKMLYSDPAFPGADDDPAPVPEPGPDPVSEP